MEADQKLKIFVRNIITINFTLEEISTPLDDLHVRQLKTYQKATRETTTVARCGRRAAWLRLGLEQWQGAVSASCRVGLRLVLSR